MTIKVIETNDPSVRGWNARKVWENACNGDVFVDDSKYLYAIAREEGEQVVVVLYPRTGRLSVWTEENFLDAYEDDAFYPVNAELKWGYERRPLSLT